MKRIPAIASLILFVALCVSIAYWSMQWLQPEPRPIAAAPAVARESVPLSAAAVLFGGGAGTGAGNLQLTGIILADPPGESIALIAVDGAPARPYRAGKELKPGIRLETVEHRQVTVSQQGGLSQLSLPVTPGTSNVRVTPAPDQTPVPPQANTPPPQASPQNGGLLPTGPLPPHMALPRLH